MKRVNIKYGMGRFFGPLDPSAKIAPPVFKTPLDAWHHFVRHKDEYEMYQNLPDDLDPQRAFGQSTDDVYDSMMSAQERVLFLSPKDKEPVPEAGASAPAPVPAHGNGDEAAADGIEEKEPATHDDIPSA